LTAIESFVDATVEIEAFEPVRRAKAARRGRGAKVELFAAAGEALRLIRAASSFKDGRRPEPGFGGASTD